MAMSVQHLRESQALHIDYYRQNKKTANLLNAGRSTRLRALVKRRCGRSTGDRRARDAHDCIARAGKFCDSEEVRMGRAFLTRRNSRFFLAARRTRTKFFALACRAARSRRGIHHFEK
jgi:hypothetical protein